MNTCVDLNCDMGESFGAWRMGADAEVMPWITSANIACGFHAGDPATMHATVKAAVAAGVAIGAHVGLPDKQGFGRRLLEVTAAEVHAMTVVQLGALLAMAAAQGARVGHLKPHGALYHMAEKQPELAAAMVEATRAVDAGIRIVGLAAGTLVTTAAEAGLAVGHEGFVDRRYRADGTLSPRSHPEAVIDQPEHAVEQAVMLAREGRVVATNGATLTVRADTLCIHGDRADAAHFARRIHDGLIEAGLTLRHLGT